MRNFYTKKISTHVQKLIQSCWNSQRKLAKLFLKYCLFCHFFFQICFTSILVVCLITKMSSNSQKLNFKKSSSMEFLQFSSFVPIFGGISWFFCWPKMDLRWPMYWSRKNVETVKWLVIHGQGFTSKLPKTNSVSFFYIDVALEQRI